MKSVSTQLLVGAAMIATAACSSSTSSTGTAPTPAANMVTATSATAPNPDPRVGLQPGSVDTSRRIKVRAAEAIWNLKLVSNSPPSERFVGSTNSDLAFTGKYAIQGNYNGYQVWDISNPSSPKLATAYFCPASQSDVSVYKNLLFVSAEAISARLDCGPQGVPDPVSHDRIRGIRIFDITDIAHPKYLGNVQTCRGSHTHTVVEDPKDKDNVYVYISGSAGVRSPEEVPGCSAAAPEEDPNAIAFRIEVIQVPLANPGQARVVNKPPILADLAAVQRHAENPADQAARGGRAGGGGRGGAADSTGRGGGGRAGGRGGNPLLAGRGPQQCHDITVYPAVGLAGGACGGYGILLDISDAKNPKRMYAASDTNFSFWHSATFSNDGSKVLFTDEWGGGSAPRCRSTDKPEWGADAIFVRQGNNLVFKSYYKLPAPQTQLENCVAHNGSLIPIPGREVMVQGWYQGGISVFDWTDPSHPFEIAFHDRGPLDSQRLASAGSWSVYWYNGAIVSSEIARGLDIFELVPSAFLSQNEIDAAKTVHFDYLNTQGQQKLVWPPSFSLVRAYLDQLERSKSLSASDLSAVRNDLASAEKMSGQQRSDALTALATRMHGVAARTTVDTPKAHTMATAIGDLAKAR